MEALLDEHERARLARYRRESDAARFVVAAALARVALGACLRLPPPRIGLDRRCPDCGGHHGKPALRRRTGLEISLTHAGDKVGLAVARAQVGIDVESDTALAAASGASAQYLMSPDERARFDELPVQDAREPS
jgi:4'-phosphopantetheinyl transferase